MRSLRVSRARCIFVVCFLAYCWSGFCDQDRGASLLARHVEENAPAGDIRAALQAFDECSTQNFLGMHLGAEKGLLIETAVRQGAPEEGAHIVLETGCHAGDGTLRAIVAMEAREGSTIISTEGNGKWLSAAKRVVGHATKDMDIKFVPLKLAEDADFDAFLDALREKKEIDHFDTVILDQDETRFLSQLQAIVAKGFLRAGATVYVDNVKRKARRLQPYLDFVATSSLNGFETSVSPITEPYPDAVAISIFRGKSGEL